jgi:hypothetical protein
MPLCAVRRGCYGNGRIASRSAELIPRGLVETIAATSFGPIPLWTLPGSLESDKPVILCITGAWATPEDMTGLPAAVAPDWDALIMRLPGNGTPELSETSVEAWGRAVDDLIAQRLAHRVVMIMGLSIGALVALAARSPQIRRVLAIEPPLSTAKLWPMVGGLGLMWIQHPERRPVIEIIFGVSDAEIEDRCYHGLFAGGAPAEVLVGDVPLQPQRSLPRYPSFLDEADRAWLAALPGVTVREAPGAGHNIHVFSAPFLLERIRAAQTATLADADPDDRQGAEVAARRGPPPA